MTDIDEVPRILRHCWLTTYHYPHGWEPLNPVNHESFRRGQVFYRCDGKAVR